jgi:hypothetical protein
VIQMSPVFGPIGGPYVAAHGALLVLGGAALEVGAVVTSYYLFGPGSVHGSSRVSPP